MAITSQVDHAIVKDQEAVIEWSLELTPAKGVERELIRGAEWYVFRDDKIAEIRAYYLNRFDPIPQTSFELNYRTPSVATTCSAPRTLRTNPLSIPDVRPLLWLRCHRRDSYHAG